jgi:glycosyltransferase involved in cell wall biosynthesis
MVNVCVSLIVPVYNSSKYLGECVDSLLNQTMEDIEIILVNDASEDNSYEIMEKYAKSYPEKIKLINSKVNLRQGGARNLGLKIAQGEFILFVDSDDIVHPDYVKKMYEHLSNSDADYVICGYTGIGPYATCATVDFSQNKKMNWDNSLCVLNNKILNDNDRKKLLVFETGGVWTKLYRKSFLEKENLLFPEKLKYEDNYWDNVSDICTRKIILLDDILYYYRFNPNSTNNLDDLSHLDRLKIEEMIFEKFQSAGLINVYYSEVEFNIAYRYYNNSYRRFFNHIHPFPWDDIKRMRCFIKNNFPNIYKNKYLLENRKEYHFFIPTYYFPRVTYALLKIKTRIAPSDRKN